MHPSTFDWAAAAHETNCAMGTFSSSTYYLTAGCIYILCGGQKYNTYSEYVTYTIDKHTAISASSSPAGSFGRVLQNHRSSDVVVPAGRGGSVHERKHACPACLQFMDVMIDESSLVGQTTFNNLLPAKAAHACRSSVLCVK